jgi:hypothetical protein
VTGAGTGLPRHREAHQVRLRAAPGEAAREPGAVAARRAFSQTGDYTKTFTDDPVEGFAFFEESMELSRRFRALRLWTSIQYHRLAAFRAAIAADLAHARALADRVARAPALELLVNHRTTDADVGVVIDEVLAAARTLG